MRSASLIYVRWILGRELCSRGTHFDVSVNWSWRRASGEVSLRGDCGINIIYLYIKSWSCCKKSTNDLWCVITLPIIVMLWSTWALFRRCYCEWFKFKYIYTSHARHIAVGFTGISHMSQQIRINHQLHQSFIYQLTTEINRKPT